MKPGKVHDGPRNRSKGVEELGPGHTVVTILCDSGARYHSRLFNPAFLWVHKHPYPEWIAA